MFTCRAYLVSILLACSSNLSADLVLGQEHVVDPELTEFDRVVLVPPTLKDRPAELYQHLKKYLQELEDAKAECRVDKLGSLTVHQLVGACGSLEGNCNPTDLGRLDDELYFGDENESGLSYWRQYTDYCREQWLAKCNATETMINTVWASFTREEWYNARQLVDLVLREPETKDPGVQNINYRYPEAMVKFMRAKDGQLDEILQMKRGKKSSFSERFAQIVRPVCQQVVSRLKYVVLGMKWAFNNEIPLENLNPTAQSGLKMFRVCMKISVAEGDLISLSYGVFSGKKKGLMDKMKKMTLAGLGARD